MMVYRKVIAKCLVWLWYLKDNRNRPHANELIEARQNPYLLTGNPPPRLLGKINHRFKTRYFFLWFFIQYLRAGFRPHAPEGGVAMPSLSEGNLDLNIGYLDQGPPPKTRNQWFIVKKS